VREPRAQRLTKSMSSVQFHVLVVVPVNRSHSGYLTNTLAVHCHWQWQSVPVCTQTDWQPEAIAMGFKLPA
jgi:hypothetical protein